MSLLVGAAITGLWLGRPGLNLRPRLANPVWTILFLGILTAGALAAGGIRLLGIRTPYEISSFSALARVLPGLFAITAVEEALFRQGMYRWLELRSVPASAIVTTTAVIFAIGHAGPLLVGRSSLFAFYVIQTLYLIAIGWLLGQIRRVTDSWIMSWLAHAAYNTTVLVGLLF